jgi:hypothetical protein
LSAIGHQRVIGLSLIERLEKRTLEEKTKQCGLPPEALCECGEMTVRRGWYWCTQAFREWLEAKVRARQGEA